MSQPRVLLCCEHYSPSVGGVQEVMRQIAERLAIGGLNVTVATTSHPDRELDTVQNGVRVVSFAVSGNWAKGMEGAIERYRSFLLNGHFDAVLIKAAQQWTFDAVLEIIPALNCRKLFIPCGFSGLNDPLYEGYFREMPKWLRYFDGLIFYTGSYQDIDFAKENGLSRLYLVPNGVDEREFKDLESGDIRARLGIDTEVDLLLSVGSKIAGKGHWEVVRAFGLAQLSRPATLVINANVPSSHWTGIVKRHLKHALTCRWPLSWLAWWHSNPRKHKHVVIVDLPRNDLLSLFKAADLLVLASHVEYSPLVLFEAAAAGTPFLASSAGNSLEIAKWTGGGAVMPKEKKDSAEVSIEVLSHALENMLTDKKKLRAMGQTGRVSIFEKGFIWCQIVQKYRQLIMYSSLPKTEYQNLSRKEF